MMRWHPVRRWLAYLFGLEASVRLKLSVQTLPRERQGFIRQGALGNDTRQGRRADH
jgi:hypothetical protein